ncbi:DUF1028 domain-containing protein [Pimelobacter simplex]|uniref:DUF1028 domain-containing protein n=1 Tax=Nocardioides simplex TaxID=2045 RepID=A0A7J5E3M2_NOCSI|nr:DUF1028 domain-containing protein [Pimelobacter simplex]KAB2812667.1 DUF1028 domain-containing protein [Pimelobacter simplex]
MTFSVLGFDPRDGSLGFASQSHFFGVGAVVGRAEAGVGAVVSQAFANTDWPHLGLGLLREGGSPDEVVRLLVAGDDLAAHRQLLVLDATGRSAAHHGGACAPAVSSAADATSVAGGNMLASAAVAPALLLGTPAPDDPPLARRLVAALRAGEDAGGDVRGSQSAVVTVVSGRRTATPWREVLADLRVDDHPDPVAELARMLPIHEGFGAVGAALFAAPLVIGTRSAIDPVQADAMLDRLAAAEALLGGNREAALWRAVVALRAGRTALGREVLAGLLRDRPALGDFVDGLVQVGVLAAEDLR